MTPYPAIWRVFIPGHGTQYHPVTVISEPVFGHVKCEGLKAISVRELVGVDEDGYAVVVDKGNRCQRAVEINKPPGYRVYHA